jgi:hypothetical protein
MRSTRKYKLYRLWSVPLLLVGAWYLVRAAESGQLKFGLLGLGMLLGGTFALRHDLLDTSPSGLDLRQVGLGWVSLLVLAVLLILSAAVVSVIA